MISPHAQSHPCFVSTGRINFCTTTSYGIMQTSTNLRRQSRCVDLGQSSHSYHIHPHYMALHGQPRRAFLDTTYPSPSISLLGAEDDDGKLNSHVKRECDLKGHIPYQRDVKPNEYSSSRMAIFSCGTTNAHGWYVSGSNSRYVAFSSEASAASQDR
jgi:hypothetical protein